MDGADGADRVPALGGDRALRPFLAAAVADSAGIYTNALRRFDRTLEYFLTVAIADSRTAIEASELLTKVHDRSTGTEPLSGRPYSANDPDSQLWIHVTGWHSVLLCYERYGPGPLSPDDERRYWAESVVAAELQTCDPAKVRSRQDVRDYYAAVRPQSTTSEHANAAMRSLLRTPRQRQAKLWASSRLLAPATIATIPKWMRQQGGFDQPAPSTRRSSLDAGRHAPRRQPDRHQGDPRRAGPAHRGHLRALDVQKSRDAPRRSRPPRPAGAGSLRQRSPGGASPMASTVGREMHGQHAVFAYLAGIVRKPSAAARCEVGVEDGDVAAGRISRPDRNRGGELDRVLGPQAVPRGQSGCFVEDL